MFGFDPYAVPIVICTRDRLSDLLELVEWLEANGHDNIILLDQGSTWPPLLDYLDEVPHKVIRCKDNLGSRAPWLVDLWERSGWMVYTDPDVVPIEECPDDLVAHLHSLLLAHPDYSKAGVGIYIRDLGQFRDRYREELFHNAAENWLGDCHRAKVETTFALYRPAVPFTFDAVRSRYPYEARHLPFYREGAPTEEDLYYLAHAKPSGLTADGTATGGSDWARAHQGSGTLSSSHE